MIDLFRDYGPPSDVIVDAHSASVGLSACWKRPVRFRGTVRQHALSLRLALQALHGVILSEDRRWMDEDEFMAMVLDPIVTVHPDRLFFEAFSRDLSAYGLVIADRDLFEPDGDVKCGTTNVDFTHGLATALGRMRSSRATTFAVEPQGFGVKTEGSVGHTEQKVRVPDRWTRAFVQLQAAMAMPGTRLTVRPVDLLATVRFLRHHKARISPRGLRFEFPPGADARLILEPWEKIIPLKGAEHGYTALRSVRTWGRRRLALLESVLPYADSVDVYVKGRALPVFYVVKLPGIRFVLGLSGFAANAFENTAGLDRLLDDQGVSDELVARAHGVLAANTALSVDALAEKLGVSASDAGRAASRLCRQGRVIFDVERRDWRARELFAEPLDVERLFPPDERDVELARVAGQVRIDAAAVRETTKTRRLRTPDGFVTRDIVHRDWCVDGNVAGDTVSVVQNDEDRVIFGRCTCKFFGEHILARGPCAHMLALVAAAKDRRIELPSSTESEDQAPTPRRKPEREPEPGRGPEREHEPEDDEEGDE